MGPLLLIDKSVVHGLSTSELTTLSSHFSIVICPMLIQEICGNLHDDKQSEKLTKENVQKLVKKMSHLGMGVFTIGHHEAFIRSDLFCSNIKLKPQIPRSDGVSTINERGEKGWIFLETEEEVTLKRWSQGVFSEEDWLLAKNHHQYLKSYDLEQSRKDMAKMFPENSEFESLDAIVSFIDVDVKEASDQWSLIEMIAKQFGALPEGIAALRSRWNSLSSPKFYEFAEYAYYCHRLEHIFYLAVTSGKVKTSRKDKSIIDFQYLFYLPFVHGFCSGDRHSHRLLSQYFLRKEQTFIDLEELKKDLQQIKLCKDAMNEDDRKLYQKMFGTRPPPIPNSICSELWIKCRGSILS